VLTTLVVALAVYLAGAATVALICSPTLPKTRMFRNLALVWAFPAAGALFAFRTCGPRRPLAAAGPAPRPGADSPHHSPVPHREDKQH